MRAMDVLMCCSETSHSAPPIYPLSLHDALPISRGGAIRDSERLGQLLLLGQNARQQDQRRHARSEEHTSELQSHSDLVCRLLLEKKKKTTAVIAIDRAIDLVTDHQEHVSD